MALVVDAQASNDYSSLSSTSPSTSAPTSVGDTKTAVVKVEAVDITSDSESTPAIHLDFNEEKGEQPEAVDAEVSSWKVVYFPLSWCNLSWSRVTSRVEGFPLIKIAA